jgi:hypothetical protein
VTSSEDVPIKVEMAAADSLTEPTNDDSEPREDDTAAAQKKPDSDPVIPYDTNRLIGDFHISV